MTEAAQKLSPAEGESKTKDMTLRCTDNRKWVRMDEKKSSKRSRGTQGVDKKERSDGVQVEEVAARLGQLCK